MRTHKVTGPYHLVAADCAGPFHESGYETVEALVAGAHALRDKYPKHRLRIDAYNADIADGGYGDDGQTWHNGLTDDEKDYIDSEGGL
jgi:hypothetical protein